MSDRASSKRSDAGRKPIRTDQAVRRLFPVVGIGASAGGLEAFTALLNALPENTGMAFVLVQHMDPAHESALSRILARATRMPVDEVTDGTPVRPNQVYVIPSNADMTIQGGMASRWSSRPARFPRGKQRSGVALYALVELRGGEIKAGASFPILGGGRLNSPARRERIAPRSTSH